MLLKLYVFHIERDLVPTFSHILLAVDIPLSALCLFRNLNRPEHRGSVFFRAHMEILSLEAGQDFQVLYQAVAFTLFFEFGIVPAFGNIIKFSKC